jgi:hypothetical protein
VLAQQRHAQVVDTNLLGQLEGALDDVVGVDGAAFATLSLFGGRRLGHEGTSIKIKTSGAVPFWFGGIQSTGNARRNRSYGRMS